MTGSDRFQWLESLVMTWEHSSPDCARELILAIGDAGLAAAGHSVCRILASTEDIWIRDGAALAAAQLRLKESVDIIVKRIEDAGRREVGTLVYALQFLDCRPAIVLLARILAERFDHEQVEMALHAIKSIDGPIDCADAETACRILREALETPHDEFNTYLVDAVRVVEGLPKTGESCP